MAGRICQDVKETQQESAGGCLKKEKELWRSTTTVNPGQIQTFLGSLEDPDSEKLFRVWILPF
jgi:hypothetical protein